MGGITRAWVGSLAIFVCMLQKGIGLVRLNEYVEHHERLSYDADSLHNQHIRHKRSVPEEGHQVHLNFESHGRPFNLCLRRDHSVFHDNLVLEDGDGDTINDRVDLSHVYSGHLLNAEDETHCFGSIRDGVFDGQIQTPEGIYYVEPARRYFNDLQNQSFHSVIYHEKHLIDPYHHSRKAGLGHSHGGCGNTPEATAWMDSIANGVHPEDIPEAQDPLPEVVEQPPEVVDPNPTFKYSEAANVRKKRSLTNPSNKKSCSLYIQTDPLFWRHVRDQEKDDAKTEEEILSLIAQHVKAVNRIYSDTQFDGKYKHTGYQFEVQRIKIHNDSQCKSTGIIASDQNPFCIPNVDVSNFLNLHSKSNHEEFCLAYVFTYRDFTGGTLGLAWVASASGASGGICETYKRYTENINGVHHTAKRSLNTGIITFVNYNSRVPPKVSQLTLAHEIGHNFGSPHDYPQECRPGGVKGNFIMFASATSGDRDNNNKFSHCSKSNISAVLDAITDGRKPNCFTESDGAFCGNKIVEEGEECDCGFDEHECAEQCCYPRKTNGQSEEENKQNRCKRKPGAECSPSEGPCCSGSCEFIPSWQKVQCKGDDDCTEAALCDGAQAKCPEPTHKPDNVTECNQGTQVCQNGECKDTICLKYGLVSCFLTSELVNDKRQLCELACQRPGNGTCMSTRDLVKAGLVPDLPSDGLSLRPGSPCDNFQGYCDVFLKCRKVDAEGPLARLKNLLFNEQTLLTIAEWVTSYWWGVLLLGIGLVITMAIFIKCCAIHTPSSNPNMPKNRHIGETLRRPVRTLQRKHYRQASAGHGAPPPYPGRGQPTPSTSQSASGASGGPGHGYGEGRGHYNRARHPDDNRRKDRRSWGGDGRGGGAGPRGSRIEMQPMR